MYTIQITCPDSKGNYSSYKPHHTFLCETHLRIGDIIHTESGIIVARVESISNTDLESDKNLVLIFPTHINGVNINDTINKSLRPIYISIEIAKKWYLSDNLELRSLALSSFKEEEINLKYEDICRSVRTISRSFVIPESMIDHINAYCKLIISAKYFNRGWEKHDSNIGFSISRLESHPEDILVSENSSIQGFGEIYFQNEKDAEKAIEILGDNIKFL